jgi:hypothetical protein
MAFSASFRRDRVLCSAFEADLKIQSALLGNLFLYSVRNRHIYQNKLNSADKFLPFYSDTVKFNNF